MKIKNLAANMRHFASPSIVVCFVSGILFVLFTLFPVRLDLSKGRAYTLSPSTRKIIQSINKQATVTIYVSSDLPTRVLPLKNEVMQLLQEYQRSGRNIRILSRDPKNDSKASEKAKELGIPQLQFSQLEQNKYQTSSFFFGVSLEYDGKTEIIPQVSDYSNLEYNITSALYRLTKKEMPQVALVGEPMSLYGQQGETYSLLKQVLSQQYTVGSVSLKNLTDETRSTLKSYNTLFVLDDGSTPYESGEIDALKQAYESGTNLVVMAGGVWIDGQTLQARLAEHNLNELTATYGAQINSDLALSTSAEYVNFGNATMQFLAPYPFWIRTNLFNKQTGLFPNIQYVTYPWVSSITPSKGKKTKATPLIATSDKSWTQQGTFVLDPNQIPQPKVTDLKEMTVAIQIQHEKGGVMLVIPSSRFAIDQYLSRASGNIDFILNAVDSMSSHGALSGIRSRALSFSPLPDMNDTSKNVYKYAALLSGTLLWLTYGGIRLYRRQRSR